MQAKLVIRIKGTLSVVIDGSVDFLASFVVPHPAANTMDVIAANLIAFFNCIHAPMLLLWFLLLFVGHSMCAIPSPENQY